MEEVASNATEATEELLREEGGREGDAARLGPPSIEEGDFFRVLPRKTWKTFRLSPLHAFDFEDPLFLRRQEKQISLFVATTGAENLKISQDDVKVSLSMLKIGGKNCVSLKLTEKRKVMDITDRQEPFYYLFLFDVRKEEYGNVSTQLTSSASTSRAKSFRTATSAAFEKGPKPAGEIVKKYFEETFNSNWSRILLGGKGLYPLLRNWLFPVSSKGMGMELTYACSVCFPELSKVTFSVPSVHISEVVKAIEEIEGEADEVDFFESHLKGLLHLDVSQLTLTTFSTSNGMASSDGRFKILTQDRERIWNTLEQFLSIVDLYNK